MEQTITFDAKKTLALQLEYNKAIERGDETFMFEGKEFYVGYAKYMLMYLNDKLGNGV